jgi:pyrroloquinoline quinone biosynthesis protein D
MSDAVAIDPEARPRLARGVRLAQSETHGGWVLLGPERVFKADAIAAEIVKRCNGEATFAEIIDDLVKTYAAPREKIVGDVTALLSGLRDKMMLEL